MTYIVNDMTYIIVRRTWVRIHGSLGAFCVEDAGTDCSGT